MHIAHLSLIFGFDEIYYDATQDAHIEICMRNASEENDQFMSSGNIFRFRLSLCVFFWSAFFGKNMIRMDFRLHGQRTSFPVPQSVVGLTAKHAHKAIAYFSLGLTTGGMSLAPHYTCDLRRPCNVLTSSFLLRHTFSSIRRMFLFSLYVGTLPMLVSV